MHSDVMGKFIMVYFCMMGERLAKGEIVNTIVHKCDL